MGKTKKLRMRSAQPAAPTPEKVISCAIGEPLTVAPSCMLRASHIAPTARSPTTSATAIAPTPLPRVKTLRTSARSILANGTAITSASAR